MGKRGGLIRNRIRDLREQAGGLTQQELAQRMSVPQSTISAYERGVRVPSVTTLERMLFGSKTSGGSHGLKFMAVDQSVVAIVRAIYASVRGQLGERPVRGVHVEQGDIIRIDSERSSVILDGEEFEAIAGRPILLRSTPPVPFLSLAA